MAELFQNFSSGVLSADPGVAGTTLASGNLAFLPLVVAPATMRLALDPEGVTGVPEIVVVTAHAASATTCTVIRGQESGFGAGPVRAHVVGTTWRMVQTRESIMALMVPAGSVIATVKATPDPGYAFINGQTLVNAQVLYPAAWAAVPGSWKAAPNLNLPDWSGRTLFMDDVGALFVLGGTGGANTHLLTQAELPAVTLPIDPASFDIIINPPPTAVTGSTGAGTPHVHTQEAQGSTRPEFLAPGDQQVNLPLFGDYPTGSESTHAHPAGSLAVDIGPIVVPVDVPALVSGPLGSGTAIDIRPAHAVVNFALKIH